MYIIEGVKEVHMKNKLGLSDTTDIEEKIVSIDIKK